MFCGFKIINMKKKIILLQGIPGIGKTTLIKNVVQSLNKLGQDCDGFYTEEIKMGRSRIGFDIVTLSNERAILARKKAETDTVKKLPQVGQYTVYIDEFEKLALPVFENPKQILVVDEIGKMELFSKKFEAAVKSTVAKNNIIVLATVPLKGGPFLVKQLKEKPENKIITVDQNNRNNLAQEIIKLMLDETE